ncbi:MAG: 4'-phosphopantetheinyl transferase family protein, partial [Burkholderiales bacterium]
HVDQATAAFDKLLSDLDHAAQRRASRFRSDADRARFVVARSSLRHLLATELGVENRELEFCENAFGKPFLLKPAVPMHFNTSHSGAWVLHALDTVAPVGVDVELVQPGFANTEDFERVLSPEERLQIAGSPETIRATAFARAWVRKEAYVKALGEGMNRTLAHISIGEDSAGRPRLLYDRNPARSTFCWQFEEIEIDAKHVACVVYGGADEESAASRAAVVRNFEPSAFDRL